MKNCNTTYTVTKMLPIVFSLHVILVYMQMNTNMVMYNKQIISLSIDHMNSFSCFQHEISL